MSKGTVEYASRSPMASPMAKFSPRQAVFKTENIILRSADAAEWLQCASRLRSGHVRRTCPPDFSTIHLYNT